MANIFGRGTSGFGGAFTSALAQMNISGNGAGQLNKLLVTQLQANYTQPLNRVYELGSDLAYFVVGRPNGEGTMGSVFGPKAYSEQAYIDLANPCKTNNLSFSFSKNAACDANSVNGEANTGGGWGRTLQHVILQSLGFQVNSQDMLINENIGFQFAALETNAK
jgi:hypothetical protein